jgi:CO dehydrogenase maturation factor
MRSLEREYRIIIEDSEAGLEHISRGTVGKPDVLLIVSDPGARGLRTAERIRLLARSAGIDPARSHLVINRFRTAPDPERVPFPEPFIRIPYDPTIEWAEINGIPVADIPEKSPARHAVRELATRLLALPGRQECLPRH